MTTRPAAHGGSTHRVEEFHDDVLRETIERMGPRLYRFAYAMLSNREVADDVVQECFIRYWRELQRNAESFMSPGWFYKVTARLCIDEARRQKRQGDALKEIWDHERLLPGTNAVTDEHDPREELWVRIQALNPKDRLAVVLVYYDELPLKEAAEIMGTTATFLKTKLARIRKKLAREEEPSS